MNVVKVGYNPNANKSVGFKGNDKSGYENPVSRKTERNLAILGATCGAGVVGAIAYGFTTTFAKTKQTSILVGLATAAGFLAVTLPAKIYNTKVNAFVKQKEMDVFSRDRELKSDLTEEVGKEVKDPEVSLDKKLDDNLKLQMANRGAAVGIANITSQSQG